MRPTPSRFAVEISRQEDRTYTATTFTIQSGPTPSEQVQWAATINPPKSRTFVALPLESPPASFLNQLDFQTIYYPNWDAVRSQVAPLPVEPDPSALPREGYIVRLSGADVRGFSRMLNLAQTIRSRLPRLRFSIRPHPQFNLAKMLLRSIGSAVGFSNIHKIKVCGDRIFFFITCATTAETAQILTTITSIYQTVLLQLRREDFISEKVARTIIIHRRRS
jgi:hypothetical protein